MTNGDAATHALQEALRLVRQRRMAIAHLCRGTLERAIEVPVRTLKRERQSVHRQGIGRFSGTPVPTCRRSVVKPFGDGPTIWTASPSPSLPSAPPAHPAADSSRPATCLRPAASGSSGRSE